MRVFGALAACCLSASSAFAVDPQDIYGTWRLTAATRKLVDTNEVIDAYGGPRPNGWIIFSKDGRMMVMCAFEGRQKPEANDKMTDQDRIHLHKTFFAYAGKFEFTGKQITYHIDTSWNEVWSGVTQTRDVEPHETKLIYSTQPFKFNVDGKMSVITLTYEKNQ